MAAAAVCALVGVLGWKLFLGPSGGASSPEAAVERFIEAASDQDVVGALSMLDPDEIQDVDRVYAQLHDSLEEQGLVPKSGVFGGAEVSVSDLKVQADHLSDHVSRVVITDGTLEVTVDPQRFSEGLEPAAYGLDKRHWSLNLPEQIGWKARNAAYEVEGGAWAFEHDCSDIAADGSLVCDDGFSGWKPALIVVEKHGRWYVSPLASVLDLEVRDYELGTADFGDYEDRESHTPVVGETPEEALRNTIEAVGTTDPDAFLDTLSDDQTGILRAYAPIVRQELVDWGVSADASIRSLDVSVSDEHDGLVRITLDNVSVDAEGYDGEGNGGVAQIAVRGPCIDVDDEQDCLEDTFVSATEIRSYYLVARDVGGGWQIDPMATASAYLNDLAGVPSDLLMSAFDLEGLKRPQQTLSATGAAEISLDSAGSAMVAVEAKAGQYVVVETDDQLLSQESEIEVYSPDRWRWDDWGDVRRVGGWSWASSADDEAAGAAVLADETGTYRFLVSTWDPKNADGQARSLSVTIADTPPSWWESAEQE